MSSKRIFKEIAKSGGTVPKTVNRLSKIFQPISAAPKDAQVNNQEFTSKSQRLMLELGIIKQASPGCYHFLPIGVRSLQKLTNLVDQEMRSIGGQKMIFPTLINSKLWEITGRLQTVSSELFKLKDRHNQEYILSPTHEEAATELLASIAPISQKQLPIKLYQITNKFRDEMKPRFGLIRGKQFLMKDMYSFDSTLEGAQDTYLEVGESYDRIFRKIGVNFIKVLGHSGNMGGNLSHEYHYEAEIGEDKIITCPKCRFIANSEVYGEDKCPRCNHTQLSPKLGIEVGHTFLLGDKYSKPLKATYLAKNGKPEILQMGSYGLGISRIISAAVEVLSSEQEIRWPIGLAPFLIAIIPPKAGSKEEAAIVDMDIHNNSSEVDQLYYDLEEINNLRDNVLVDDRSGLTIGRRFLEAKRMGYPYIVVLGNKMTEDPPLYELTDLQTGERVFLDRNNLLRTIQEKTLI